MNVVYHHRTQFTGIERVHITGMVTGLRRIGHHVTIVGPPGTDPEKETGTSSPGGRPGISSLWKVISNHAPEILFECLEILYNFYSLLHLLLYLRAKKVDLIYERYALFQCGGVLAAHVRKIPIILEVNDSALIKRTRNLRSRRMALWFERRILRSADLLVTISSCFKDKLSAYQIDDGRIHVLPNAIDPDILSPQKEKEQNVKRTYRLDGRLIIGFVGFFVPWHGLPLLLDVFARLSAEYGLLHLLLVGDGPEKAALASRIQQMGLMQKVTMTGYVSHDEVPIYIDSFDVAVMPDSNEHGSPMKIFEYMGMAKPVVAPSYAPIREVLRDGENALLFEPNDAAGLYRALETLINNKGLRKRLGESGRRDVLAKHTWQHNALEVVRGLRGVSGGSQ
jgi:glycosyltransferase involved in cell wall biosynthesis